MTVPTEFVLTWFEHPLTQVVMIPFTFNLTSLMILIIQHRSPLLLLNTTDISHSWLMFSRMKHHIYSNLLLAWTLMATRSMLWILVVHITMSMLCDCLKFLNHSMYHTVTGVIVMLIKNQELLCYLVRLCPKKEWWRWYV